MSTGTVSKSQSLLNFHSDKRIDAGTNAENHVITQVKKRPRIAKDIEYPTIYINGDEAPLDAPFNSASNTTVINNRHTSLEEGNMKIVKLNRLRDKDDRYESHISFLNDCIDIKRIPNGLVIDLEPSIGNNDEAFRAKWYQRLEEFSLTLMKDIVEYSENVKEETSAKIKTEEESLKISLNADDYNEVSEALNKNSANRKYVLKQNKRKKFHHLKYHRAAPTHKPFQPTNGQERPAPNTGPPNDNRGRNENRSLRTNHYQPQEKTWSSLFRSNSRTNIRNSNIRTRNHDNNRETNTRESNNNSNFQDNKHKSNTDNQIQELQNEIIALKAAKQTTEHPKKRETCPSPRKGQPTRTNHISKQGHSGCRTGNDFHQQHYGNFSRIQKTIRKTTTYRTDPLGYVINLTNKYFTYNDFKLLNKNLNFVPNPGIYNKHVFEKDKNTFFHRMMLKSHFGNTEPIQYKGYRNKTNKDWLPDNTHHTVKTFIESVSKDLENTQSNENQPIRNNLTKGEIHSLIHLKEKETI